MRRLRQELGWTQVELAHHLGVSQPLVSAWEAGHRHPGGAALLVLRGLAARVDLPHAAQPRRPRELMLDAALSLLERERSKGLPAQATRPQASASAASLLTEHRRRMGEEVGRLLREARRLDERHPRRWAYFEQARLSPGSKRGGVARREALRVFMADERLTVGLGRWYRHQVAAVLDEASPDQRDLVELMVLAVDALWVFELIGLRRYRPARRLALVEAAVRGMRR